MFDQIWTLITEQLKTNNFLSGGAVLMVGGWLLHAIRDYPLSLYDWVRERFIVQIDIPDRSDAFAWVNRWLAEHSYTRNRARFLTVTTRRNQDDREDSQPQIILSPAPGTHYILWRRRLLMLTRTRSDSRTSQGETANPTSKTTGFASLFPTETFTLKIVTRKRQLARELLEEARELVCPSGDGRLCIHVARWGAWNSDFKRLPRPMDSVVLDGTMLDEMQRLVTKFLSGEKWYSDRGIPHRLGFLLKGPPGSGKSSSVVALASALKMDVAIVNLASKNLDDDGLSRLLVSTPKHTFLLIEDIDCVWEQREKNSDDNSGITFSGLLNAIDGVAAAEGRVLFMTTNHPEKLDPALVRPGRIDYQFEIANASASQICRLFSRFYPEATDTQTFQFVNAIVPGSISMARLQGHMTKYADDVELALKHVGELA